MKCSGNADNLFLFNINGLIKGEFVEVNSNSRDAIKSILELMDEGREIIEDD